MCAQVGCFSVFTDNCDFWAFSTDLVAHIEGVGASVNALNYIFSRPNPMRWIANVSDVLMWASGVWFFDASNFAIWHKFLSMWQHQKPYTCQDDSNQVIIQGFHTKVGDRWCWQGIACQGCNRGKRLLQPYFFVGIHVRNVPDLIKIVNRD